MFRLLADENFRGNIIRGLIRRIPTLDVTRVQDEGLSGADDPSVLEWAADNDRIVLTHDLETMPVIHSNGSAKAKSCRECFTFRTGCRRDVP